ncbi:hypothetical protein ACQKK5_19120 [Brevibacillus panacihumi]|uniref:hypothetical protein n=1 Tax=Brevibacillus panacihumi TaxID=497735 RepID=UPI003D00CAD2
MATVTSTLKMFDQITGPMQRITQALNLTISSMERMQKTAERNMTVDKSLIIAKQQLSSAEAAIRAEIDRANQSQREFNKTVNAGERGVARMLNSVKAMVATYLTFTGAQSVFNKTMGAAFQRQQLVDTLAARANSAEIGLEIYERVRKQALAANENVDRTLANTMQFMSNTMDPAKLEHLNMLAMRLQKLNPAEGIEGAGFALKELMSGDYTSIAERFNMSRTMLQNSAARNAGLKNDVDGFIKGMDQLLNQQKMTQDAFERMLDSPASRWARAVNRFQDNMANAGSRALKAFLPLIDLANKFFDSGKAEGFFDGLTAGLRVFADITARTAKFIYDNWDLVKAGLVGTGVVLSALLIQWTVGWVAASWPVLLVIAVITGLMWALNEFGVTTDQVIGYATGAFYGLAAAVGNHLTFMNNNIVAFAEFLANIFEHPVYAIQKLFYDMTRNVVGYFEGLINTILDGLNSTIERINQISGASISLIPRIDQSFIDQFKPEMPKGAVDLSAYRWDYQNIGEQMQKGYSAGLNFVNKFQDTLDKMQVFSVPAGMNQASFADSIASIGKVGEVGKIRDEVAISNEDLRLMREYAEQQNIQNFVTLQPQFSFGDTHIKQEGRTVDEIIGEINRQLEEGIASTARAAWNV